MRAIPFWHFGACGGMWCGEVLNGRVLRSSIRGRARAFAKGAAGRQGRQGARRQGHQGRQGPENRARRPARRLGLSLWNGDPEISLAVVRGSNHFAAVFSDSLIEFLTVV